MTTANPFAIVTDFADNPRPPPDALRRAAESIDLGTIFVPSQLRWIESHDWYDGTVCNRVIVTDSYTYKGQSYSERIIWGGTFAELRAWAGY